MIPTTLIRVVPEHTSDQVEQWWKTARNIHSDWDLITHRDPLDPADWPLTRDVWDRCKSGAQLAGLIRLEALLRTGGVYIDSDVELYRRLDPLRSCSAFGLWEDDDTVPDFVLGAEPAHPAIVQCLELALERIRSDVTEWRIGNGAWGTGPGVTTTILPGRSDVLLLPPQSFAPWHYLVPNDAGDYSHQPYTFGAHHWAHSWEGN